MNNKPNDYILLKQRRDIGDAITAFFEFFKKNLKPFTNIFISYNGIFILGFLGVSYMLVTGFAGTLRRTNNFGIVAEPDNSELFFGLGILGFVLLFMATALLNYSLAASYVVNYEKNGTTEVEKKQVWKLVYDNIGKIIVFILLLSLIYIGVFIVGIIISFIPILGTFAYYGIMMGFTSWMGLSFMALLHKNMEVTSSFGEGWKLLTRYFWKCVLVNLVVGMILGVLFLIVLMVPGILIAIYAFHAMETGVDLANSAVATIVWTIGLTILLVVSSFNQSISQFSNGILYFSLYEETYNEHTRKMIDQIGESEEV